MQPIPCQHCGFNFMRQTIDPEAPRLCNSCAIREEKRSPTKRNTMQTIDIIIKCPVPIQAEIEEICINKGIDFSKYFISLHETFVVRKNIKEEVKLTDVYIDPKPSGKPDFVVTRKEIEEKPKQPQPKGKKK